MLFALANRERRQMAIHHPARSYEVILGWSGKEMYSQGGLDMHPRKILGFRCSKIASGAILKGNTKS